MIILKNVKKSIGSLNHHTHGGFLFGGVKPIKRDRILIEKNLIPYRMEILLGAELYTLNIQYNKTYDLITIGLENTDGEVLCEAEPVVYGQPLWQDVQYPGGYPALRIIPWDNSGQENAVTFDNFNETVFLTVDNAEESLVGEV